MTTTAHTHGRRYGAKSALLLLASCAIAGAARAQVPHLKPWVYGDTGALVWTEHRYYETPGNTVFAIGREITTVPNQSGEWPEVLLCNFAAFDPPEGVTATTRRLAKGSLVGKGLQLYVNYSQALVDPGQPNRYLTPTFFVSTQGNNQTNPTVVNRGFFTQFVSATRAAFGVYGQAVPAHSQVMQVAPSRAIGAAALLSDQVNAVFVTASIGFAKTDIDPLDAALVDDARRCRLLLRDANGKWNDHSLTLPTLLPTSVTDFNTSGVVFADLDGDGFMDLYVGQQGDNYRGRQDCLLIYRPTTGQFVDETSVRISTALLPANATSEVAAADLDRDGDLDIVSVGRLDRAGNGGAHTADFVLINDGRGRFTVTNLAPSVQSDSRSVAIADLDADAYPEIVIANAGADGFSNVLTPAQDHPTQIFRRTATNSTYLDVQASGTPFIQAPTETFVTAPWAVQVLAVDVFGQQNLSAPARWTPDGAPDLVFVNHRDILLSQGLPPACSVYVLANMGAAANPLFQNAAAYPTLWGQTVTVENFAHTFQPAPNQSVPVLHFFHAGGNRFQGALSRVTWNDGPTTILGAAIPWKIYDDSYDMVPGSEHGYGFDFADYDANDVIDAGQCARSYDFLAWDIGQTHSPQFFSPDFHFDFTVPWSSQLINNVRGRKNPRGGEDVCFFKMNADDMVHALFVGQRIASASTPSAFPHESAQVCVLEGMSTPQGFLHDTGPWTLVGGGIVLGDAKINPNGRLNDRRSNLGDRVELGDMDNDGKPDAMVLYQGILETTGQLLALEPPDFTQPIQDYLTGWSYLKNVKPSIPTPASKWFREVTGTRMQDVSGAYSRYWNRGLGSLTIADFDNDGRLDFYTTCGLAVNAQSTGATTWTVESTEQLRDLLFLNLPAPAAAGTLRESPASPPLVREQIQDSSTDTQTDSAGSFFVTQGDIDNDGDADIVVAHTNLHADRTAPPALYMNNLVSGGALTDEYLLRVDPAGLSPITIHSKVATDFGNNTLYGGAPMDDTWAVALADIDSDGDLDMMCAVAKNVPRILLNKGQDTNGDGRISPADPLPSQCGYFQDVTDTAIPIVFPQHDAQDIQAVDLDFDGDIDLAIDSFQGNVSLWRNDLTPDGQPRITHVWPRVGSIRRNGPTIEFRGKGLTSADTVRFIHRSASGTTVTDVTGTAVTTIGDNIVRVQLPTTLPLGLAQVQVKVGSTWSKQYFGYFIQS